MNIDKLTPDERAGVLQNLREAAFHLASCWDALRDAEDALGTDMDVEGIPTAGFAAHNSAITTSLQAQHDQARRTVSPKRG